ncbi:MAG: FecR domain-containing protein [Anaerolineales bacterium]|nr:FecR domain-containing protein [Anaerolineales bacterium]
MEEEILFQENLERLEAGEAFETVLEGVTEEQAAQLRLVQQIRAVSQFAREPQVVANQHQHIMHLWKQNQEGRFQARSEARSEAHSEARPKMRLPTPFLKWLLPIGAAMLLCMAVFCITTGTVFLLSRGNGVAEVTPDREIVKAPEGTPPGETTPPITTPSPNDPSPVGTPQSPTAEAFPPLIVPEKTPPVVSAPHVAVLKAVNGLVQIQQPDNSWLTVETAEIQAGQTFRTWVASSAELYFFDGSVVTLAANTRLTLEVLNAPLDGPREITLFQPYGETSHTVAPGSAASYAVRTPSAFGTAKGTIFQVVVNEDKSSDFSVVEGIVDVTGNTNTVQLYTGEMTSVAQHAEPSEPVFWITGEGEVSQMGEVWVIGGVPFQTQTGTIIIGEPQIGDLVSVRGRLLPDGTRLADRIALLAPAPHDQFRLTGLVEQIGAESWAISGQEIRVNETTYFDPGIETGSRVLVTGIIREGGVLFATHITLLEEEARFEFTGLVEHIEDRAWTIAGVPITTDQTTEITGDPVVGDLVKVEGQILTDGTWLASEIKKVSETNRFAFTGTVQSIVPWVVSGIFFEVNEFTFITPGITVGSQVRVEGRILEDGTWLATSIQLLDDANTLVFIGIVDSIAPWMVNGLALTVDENTVFIGDIAVASLVRVAVLIQPDGAWLALRMELIEVGPVVGCIEFADVVFDITRETITLATGLVIPRAIADIEGDLQTGSQVLVKLCFGPENEMVYAFILVIGEPLPPRPTPTPTLPPRPTPLPTVIPPPSGGGSLTITENDQTISFNCDGGTVTVLGNNNTVTLYGNCVSITVRGNNNVVTYEGSPIITNTGNNNIITHR